MRGLQEAWPFGIETLIRFAYVPQLTAHYEGEVPIFHFVVNFNRGHAGVPVVIRQTLRHHEETIPAQEMWAIMIHPGTNVQALQAELDRQPFWIDQEVFMTITRG